MKQYKKPEILFEDFSLSTNIAAGCFTIANSSLNQCGVPLIGVPGVSGLVVFTEMITGCSTTEGVKVDLDGNPTYNGVCYQNPSDTTAVFSS